MAIRHCAILPRLWVLSLSATATLTVSFPQAVEARDEAQHRIDIPPTSLATAMAELARQTGDSIGTQGSLPQRRTLALRGVMSVETALKRRLEIGRASCRERVWKYV